MTDFKPNPLFRLMPSLADVAFVLPFLFLFTRMEGVRHMLADGDTGWHIRAGDWILANGRVPSTDIFSFTKPGEPWFAWEWLWDTGAAFLHQRWGLAGVVLPSMLLLGLTFALLYRLALRRSGNPLFAIGLTSLAAAASTIHWLARPHLFTMLFTVVVLSVLERVREGRIKLLWWLPALTVLWTNLHGGFIVGIGLLCIYGAGELLRASIVGPGEDRAAAAKGSVKYWLAAGGCLAASLANPYGYALHVHIWRYLRDPYAMQNIVEFQSANFHHGVAVFLEAMLIAAFAAAVWFAVNKRMVEVLLLVGLAHMALLMARNIPIFGIAAAPLVAEAAVAASAALRRAQVARWPRKSAAALEGVAGEILPFERLWRFHAICAVPLLVVMLGMASPAAGKKLKPEYDPKAYPSRALALLNSSMRIFTHDEWGDYLIYQLAPAGVKVFVDGRSDFYGAKFCQEYLELLGAKYNWQRMLSRYRIDTVLLPVDSALASTLKESGAWRVGYDDGAAIIFQAAAGVRNSTGSAGGRSRDPRVAVPKITILRDREISQSGGTM